ncbi:MAG: hypothetical protein CVV39_08960, partial [Planctomycetes bacterium HGW-Planctomycetes-1]
NIATVNGSDTSGAPIPGAVDNETIEVIRDVKLSLIKTANVTSVAPGDTLTYTITVRNDGDSSATNVIVDDTLPVGLNCTGPVGNCVPGTPHHATWTLASLAPHTSITLEINATVTSAAVNPAHNFVEVISDEDSANATLDIPVRTPTLTIDKSANKRTGDRAEIVEYTLVVRNTGTGPATNITIRDVDDDYDNNAGNVDCGRLDTLTIPDVDYSLSPSCVINNGLSVTAFYFDEDNVLQGRVGFDLTITSTLNANDYCVIKYRKYLLDADGVDGVGTNECQANYWMNNTANITNAKYLDGTDMPRELTWNDTWDVLVTLTQVEFTKDVTPVIVQPGDQVTYTLNVSNAGSDITAVIINDTLPIGFVSDCGSITAVGGTIDDCSCTFINNHQVCTLNLSDIASNNYVTVTIVANVTSNAPDGQNDNIARLDAVRGNPLPTKTATATNYVFRPRLTITKLVNDTKIINAKPGDTVNYTIIIKNTDTIANATNVIIRDELPGVFDPYTVVTNSMVPAGCAVLSNSIGNVTTWNISTLANNNSQCQISYTIQIPERNVPDGLYPNFANITHLEDNDGGALGGSYGLGANDSARVNIITVTNLKVTKSADPIVVEPEDQVNFTITVTNEGATNPVYNVQLTDDLPPGFTFVEIADDTCGATCNAADPV